jgi:RNA polymerase sigma factor (sigma-70 family)
VDRPEEVTRWIKNLESDDEAIFNEAARQLVAWAQPRIEPLARKSLAPDVRRCFDELDICQSAYGSFFRRFENGEFPNLDDRQAFLLLIRQITRCKASNRGNAEHAAKRDTRRNIALSSGDDFLRLEELLSDPALPPDEQLIQAETWQEIMTVLSDHPDWQEIFRLRFQEGKNDEEIARTFGLVPRTVQRWFEGARNLLRERGYPSREGNS